MRKLFTLFVLFSLLALTSSFAQVDISSDLPPETKPTYQTTDAIWDIEFNHNAQTVTGALGNTGAVYIHTLNRFWTSRWGSAWIHAWTTTGTLIDSFTIASVTGTRNMCFDGTFVYHAIGTGVVQIVDPTTRTRVGTITLPTGVTARFISYNPQANSGAGGLWVGNWNAGALNYFLVSLTGAQLDVIPNTAITGTYGIAYDYWSAGGPFLWVWSQGGGAGTPQNIIQIDVATKLATGVQKDVKTDVGVAQPTTGIAGGMFITDQLITGEVTMGGVMQGSPDLFFGYELALTGAPCPVQPATNPSPANGTANVILNPGNATWTNGAGTTNIEVLFGPAGNMTTVYTGAPITSLAIPGPLTYSTTYQWRVICKNATCSATSSVWSFTTMADPDIVTLFTEDFTAGAGLWTITNEGGTVVWTVYNPPYPNVYTLPAAAVGGVFAADTDQGGTTATCLSTATLTAPIDATLYTTVWLEFDNDWQALDADDFGYVEVSVDGTTWITVKTFDVVDIRNTHENIPLTTQVGAQMFYLRFRTVQPGWDWWWAIDNVTVKATGIVPVELSSFAAIVSNLDVTLNWSTATETNNSGFEVERNAGEGFAKVGFIQGNGTTTEVKNYSFVDKSLATGSYTYRLKQIDYNGTFEYSNAVEVDVVGPQVYELSQNYPNPFNPSTKINFSLAADSKVTLKVFDVLGQEISTLVNGQLTAGSHDITFNSLGLNSGVYFYRIDAEGADGQKFSSVKKMILTK